MSPAPSTDSPSAGQPRRRSLDKKRPPQEEDPANQDSRASSEDRRTQGATRPNVLQLLSSLGELSRPQAAKPASPSLAGEPSLAGSLPGSAREDALKVHPCDSVHTSY